MSATVSCDDYVELMCADYLTRYLPRGGSVVKVVLAEREGRRSFAESLRHRAGSLGYPCVAIDAASTKLNKLEDVWFGIARQVDWMATARDFLKACLFPRFDVGDGDLSLDAIARRNGLERWVVQRALDELLHKGLIRRKGLSGEFRRAMFTLVWSLLAPNGLVANVSPYVLEWLRGELASIVPAKKAMLYRRITKTNGRQMLASLPQWLRDCRMPGLVLMIDIAAVTSGSQSSSPSSNYRRAAAIDCFEVIRQFIDSADATAGLGLWFVADGSFADDEKRGMHIYPALEMRLIQDVHDAKRANPFASMVRLA